MSPYAFAVSHFVYVSYTQTAWQTFGIDDARLRALSLPCHEKCHSLGIVMDK